MKTKHCVMGSILLFALMACALPGISQPAALPTFDPNAIPTTVALTANAAMAQTATAASPLATPDLSETTLEQLPDGSTKYTDKEIGFEITFPTGWLTLRPNSDEFSSALANEAVKNDTLGVQMESHLAGYDANMDRLYSYILRPDIEKNSLFGFSKLVWDSEDTTSIDDANMGVLIRELESSGVIPGVRVDTAQVHENSNAVMMIEIGGRYTISDGQGGTIPFYFTGIFFKPTPNSTARITYTFLQDYSVQISTDVKYIIDSVNVVGPQ